MKRRDFLAGLGLAAGGWALQPADVFSAEAVDARPGSAMSFGLVTYLWGRDWNLPTLLANCAAAGIGGVELRTTHAHGVEPELSADRRAEVKRRFEDSPVRNVGMGSDERFDNPDPAVVAAAVERTKAFVRLSHDTGGSGVKVKPDRFHPDVPRAKTIEQIGKALNEVATFADGWGQEIRLEVHGQCAELPTIRAIMEVADHPGVAVCWNCNGQDLQGEGLEANFRMVRERFGRTLHVRELHDASYPYPDLFRLLVSSDYDGWVLLEARGNPADRVRALRDQREMFEGLVAWAKALDEGFLK